MSTLTVEAARSRRYDVTVTTDVDTALRDVLGKILGPRRRLIVTSPTVSRFYGRALREAVRATGTEDQVLVLECGETTKGLTQVVRVCEEAKRIDLDREGVLVSLGGGVCMDIVTVAASWLHRGVGHVRVPTTLTGQVDAAIGIKGAVNFDGKKSYLGCFHPPVAAIIAPTFLRTLPRRHLRAGLAEIAKIAIVRDARLFMLAESCHSELVESGFQSPPEAAREVLWRSVSAMVSELEQDLYEDRTWQRKVDLGHTISPVLEARCAFELAHGEAVAIDIAFSSALASHLGLLASETCARITSLLIRMGLPVWVPELDLTLCQLGLRDAATRRGGRVNLVVPTEIGGTAFIADMEELPDDLLEASLHSVKGLA